MQAEKSWSEDKNDSLITDYIIAGESSILRVRQHTAKSYEWHGTLINVRA